MKIESRCPGKCDCHHDGRRDFIKKTALFAAGATILGDFALGQTQDGMKIPVIKPFGQASRYEPVVKAAFVRRKGEYGLRWPGAVYDGEAARIKYTENLKATAASLNIKLEINDLPLYTPAEADVWLQEAKDARVDGILVLLLDRQEHAWPTARKASETGIPLVVFSPLGTSFTTNTAPLAGKPGCVIYSTDNYNQLAYGLKMLGVKARMNHTRCVVIAGNIRKEEKLADTGITLQYIPAGTFIEMYRTMPESREMIAMADDYILKATAISKASRQDVINGLKSYLVAGRILENEKADAISMDCLGALANEKVSLPCISWSRMNDDGIPAACEADLGAIATHVLVQYLFSRPGFQQDPVADTSDDTIIGAHCSCPTRLNGFSNPPEPFDIIHHHGNRDAVPRTVWKIGQRITCLDFLPGDPLKNVRSHMLISSGTVLENLSVPPSGGCVVSVKVKLDGGHEVLNFPGFHQLFFYGDYKRELEDFGQLVNYEVNVV
jgi:hypothetical protein